MKKSMRHILLTSCSFLLLGCTLNATYTVNVRDFVTNTQIDKNKGRKKLPTPESIPADMAYWIADIKLNDKGATIIELGDGNFAGYKVLDNMRFSGNVWTQVWDYLLKLNLPIWFVGNPEASPGLTVVAWDKFKQESGLHSYSLEELQKNPEFLRQAKKSTSTPAKKLTDYQGLIVLKRYNPSVNTFENFVEKYPNFLILNETSSQFVSDKYMTDNLFTTPEMRKTRPQAIAYSKKFTPSRAQDILSNFSAEWLVIKPINSGRGNGIVYTSRAELSNTLRKVLVDNRNNYPINNDYSFKPDTPMSYEYWRNDRNSRFLVEEFVESKSITVNNKPYDATMRIIFMMRYEQGEIKLDILDGYWKRPLVALNEVGTFKEKHMSKHAPNFEESQGLEVSAEDLQQVRNSLNPVLPQLFWNILVKCYTTVDPEQQDELRGEVPNGE